MKYFYSTLIVISLLMPVTLLAQTADEAPHAIPDYDVELVIFKNVHVPKSKEFILPLSSPSRGDKILDLSSAQSVQAAEENGYRILSVDEFRLLPIVGKIVRSTRYELLVHAGWRQPGLDHDNVIPVWIKGGRIYGEQFISIDNKFEYSQKQSLIDDASPSIEPSLDEETLERQELVSLSSGGLYELEGKITIALARYLHTYTDLVLRRPRLTIDTTAPNPEQGLLTPVATADTRILNNHSLKEHRRMRSKTLHYLDNPEFSMIILITPFEPAEVVEETGSNTAAVTPIENNTGAE
ncbi:MAG: hypothetical protein ACI9LO_003560 [Planctomycetota bacterium]|jgi:hypothetical protein